LCAPVNNLFMIIHLIATPVISYRLHIGAAVDCAETTGDADDPATTR
jgi:hypothetical protein